MPRLTGLTFAHPSVASDRRALLSLTGHETEEALLRAREDGHDIFVLSTCLRVEIAWAGNPEMGPEVLQSIYADSTMLDEGRIRTDEAAFLHLSRVAAGLDSPLIGETEVLAQFRQAVRHLDREDAASGGVLSPILDAALGVGRGLRRSLNGTPRGSLALQAAQIVADSGRVAILGGGAMARAAAESLEGNEVVVFTRRPMVVGGKPSDPWESIPDGLRGFSAAISTIPGPLPSPADGPPMQSLQDRRQPLLFVDLGMPPLFGSPPGNHGLRYLGIDDVASSIDATPPTDVEQAAVTEARVAWGRLAVPDGVGSIISAVMGRADRAADEEARRFASRLAVTDDPEGLLRQLAHNVARRILHPPISYVGSTPLDPTQLDMIARALGVPDD